MSISSLLCFILRWTTITVSVFSERFLTRTNRKRFSESPSLCFWGGMESPELHDWLLPFTTEGPEMIPVLADMHPTTAVCFFRAVRSTWHRASLLQTSKNLLLRSSKPGCNPCVACCGPCASISRPVSQHTGLTVPWGAPYSHNKEQIWKQKLPEQALVVEILAELGGGTWSAQASYGFEE